MTTFRRFTALTPRARRLLLTSAALQAGARAVLALFGLPAAVRLAERISARAAASPDLPALTWALAASAPRVGGTCLTQALVARALGRAGSRPVRLVIGARKVPRRAGDRASVPPEFHAWTEIGDATLPLTPDRASFAPMMVWS